MKRFVFAFTGASGAPFGLRVLEYLAPRCEVHLILTRQAIGIIRQETGRDWAEEDEISLTRRVREHLKSDRLHCYFDHNLAAPPASGSFLTDGMFVVPCSVKSLAGIANGYASTLVERAADVTVKEGRRLLLAPREMPFSAIHLENMLKLSRLGVIIAPPVPAFYHQPQDLDGLLDFVAGKILDAMGVAHTLFPRWDGGE